MHVETLSVGPLGCNCSIVADVAAKRAIVIDTGGDYDEIRARLDALGVEVSTIVHTHTH
ncbi:MAG: MBL fold metallo-hydrolase, partial [Polyangiaceae bacterium]